MCRLPGMKPNRLYYNSMWRCCKEERYNISMQAFNR
jgi:hypothetical protein